MQIKLEFGLIFNAIQHWEIMLYVVASLVLGGVVLLKTASMFGVMLPMIIVMYILNPAIKHFK